MAGLTMTRDDIIRMAREADEGFETDTFHEESLVGMDAIERFATLVAEHERQACARVVMSFKNWRRVELLPISEAIKSRRIGQQ